jgi:hypothetical protein
MEIDIGREERDLGNCSNISAPCHCWSGFVWVILTKSLIILRRCGELGDRRYKWRDFDQLSNFANWWTLVFEGLNILGATRERPEAL